MTLISTVSWVLILVTVATDWPGLRRRCPPLSGQRGRPGRCRDSAAPEPPAHCKFCSQNLQEEISNKRQKSHSASQAAFSRCRLSCLCRSCRSRCAWWCPSPPSGSPRWPETWSLHRATPCQSYTPFLWKKNKNKYLVFLMLKIYFYNSDLWESCCKNSISLLLSANAKGWWGHQRASNTNSRQTKLPQPSNFLMMQPGRTKKTRSNMPTRQQHVFSRSRLTAGHFGIGVLLQVSVQDGIADLVADLVCGEATDGEAGDFNAWRVKDVTFVFLKREKWHVIQQSLRAAKQENVVVFHPPPDPPLFLFQWWETDKWSQNSCPKYFNQWFFLFIWNHLQLVTLFIISPSRYCLTLLPCFLIIDWAPGTLKGGMFVTGRSPREVGWGEGGGTEGRVHFDFYHSLCFGTAQ